ncbi:TldD/PmbA family protein [bacterium]|nr:TldD/PmbA family protein [bacterium]
MKKLTRFVVALCLFPLMHISVLSAGETVDILDVMKEELNRSMKNLADASEVPMYYLQYSVTEVREYSASVTNGGLEAPSSSHMRYLDVDVRVSSMELDNTHEIRGGGWRENYSPRRVIEFPMEADAKAIKAALWNETEYQYSKAQERYTKVLTNRQVKVEEEDLSNDFSPAQPQQFTEPLSFTQLDIEKWTGILKKVGSYFNDFPFVQESSVRVATTDKTTYMVNNEGSRLQHSNHYLRAGISVSGMAEDGMKLDRYESYTAASAENLPDEATLMKDAERLVKELEALIDAPVVEPFIGPAILRHRASGVFFHEIFGHRIEGHRQKGSEEGQTFTKKVGELILPEFLSIYDDPTIAQFNGIDLRGYYKFDDEGTPAQRVTVVEKGILRNFLTTRSPIENFPESNGHSRREYGRDVVARQGNLIIHSDKAVSFEKLREKLKEECKKQGKPYGLIFDDIAGGFTMTRRWMPQAFKVIPLLVYRVYADNRPDEVVRGVDIVGTPLTCFSKIILTADDDTPFNGTCGAESGSVPVSAVSPSILVSEIEIEKRFKKQEKPPILPPPRHDK